VVNNYNRAAQGESGVSSLEKDDAAHRNGEQEISAVTQAAIIEASWDPYQVWLTRVKQPREQSARMRRQSPAVSAQASSPDLSETARLRALTIAR